MTRFQRLALVTAIATYVLVVWGGVVRVTDSGLGCPDWPLCYGQVLPPADDARAWIEWIHRTLAAAVGLLVVARLGRRPRLPPATGDRAAGHRGRRLHRLPGLPGQGHGRDRQLGRVGHGAPGDGHDRARGAHPHRRPRPVSGRPARRTAPRSASPCWQPSPPSRPTPCCSSARTSRPLPQRSSSARPGRSSRTARSSRPSTLIPPWPASRPPTRSIGWWRPWSASSSWPRPGSPGAGPRMVAGVPSPLGRRSSP